MPDRMTAAEVKALAAAFDDRTAARQLLADAGLAPERQPSWQPNSAAEFWHEVNTKLGNGILVDGRRRVLAEAFQHFPANPVFAGYAAGRPDDGQPATAEEVDADLPGGEQRGGVPGRSVDARGSQGIIVGDHGSQTLYFGTPPPVGPS